MQKEILCALFLLTFFLNETNTDDEASNCFLFFLKIQIFRCKKSWKGRVEQFSQLMESQDSWRCDPNLLRKNKNASQLYICPINEWLKWRMIEMIALNCMSCKINAPNFFRYILKSFLKAEIQGVTAHKDATQSKQRCDPLLGSDPPVVE